MNIRLDDTWSRPSKIQHWRLSSTNYINTFGHNPTSGVSAQTSAYYQQKLPQTLLLLQELRFLLPAVVHHHSSEKAIAQGPSIANFQIANTRAGRHPEFVRIEVTKSPITPTLISLYYTLQGRRQQLLLNSVG